MGLFGKKEICTVCGQAESKIKLVDGFVCTSCFDKALGFLPTKIPKLISVNEIVVAINLKIENMKKQQAFVTTKKVGLYFEVDETHGWWLVPDGFLGSKKNSHIYSTDDICDYELIEDGDTITKGGIGSALAGGLLFGGVGAVVGGITGSKKTKSTVTKLQIKIKVNDMNNPNVYVNLITTEFKKSSLTYQSASASAQEILSVLSLLYSNKETKNIQNNPSPNAADEILKYKNLLDLGAITQEEFESKKRQLL